MCGRINIRGQIYTPFRRYIFRSHNSYPEGIWGIGNAYNARIENIGTTWKWISDNRGILHINGFYEKNRYMSNPQGLNLGLIHNDRNDFVVITRESQSSILPIHHRMPLIIDNIEEWLVRGSFNAEKEFDINIR